MTFGTRPRLAPCTSCCRSSQYRNRLGRTPGPTAGGVTIGGGSLYMTTKNTDEQKAGIWDFMKFLNTAESQVTWHTSTGYIPTRLSASKSAEVQKFWTERPGYKVAYDQLANSKLPVGGAVRSSATISAFARPESALESVVADGDVAKAQTRPRPTRRRRSPTTTTHRRLTASRSGGVVSCSECTIDIQLVDDLAQRLARQQLGEIDQKVEQIWIGRDRLPAEHPIVHPLRVGR